MVKNLPAVRETWFQSLGWEDPLEKGKATHSSILAWRIPWTVSSMVSQRVFHTCCLVPKSCPALCDSMDYIVHGVLQARILEWVAIPFSRESSQPRDRTQVSHIASGFFTI